MLKAHQTKRIDLMKITMMKEVMNPKSWITSIPSLPKFTKARSLKLEKRLWRKERRAMSDQKELTKLKT